jgi:hypothetical protein
MGFQKIVYAIFLVLVCVGHCPGPDHLHKKSPVGLFSLLVDAASY